MIDSKKDEWKTITEEFIIGTTAKRWQMAPTLPMDGDWTEMELTVETVSGDMSELYSQRLNYNSSFNQYVPANNNKTSPITYSAIKDGDKIVFTRGTGIEGGGYGQGTTFSVSIKTADLGLWIHWGAPTNELKVKGTIRYK